MIYSVEQKPIAFPDAEPSEQHAIPPGTYFAATRYSGQGLLSPEQDAQSQEAYGEQLAARILERIEGRLPCRIRQLTVFASDNTVVLSGQCCTYYTKQIAQHAAMGALEYERLINNIDVQPAK